jgi:diaminopimelate epimerase
MKIKFEKYHGTGNDFIMIDIRNHAISGRPDKIAQLCNRQLGIGADGMIFLDNSIHQDFAMRYFNADGKEGSMCGNGGRCIAAFASKNGIINDKASFEAVDGVHQASIVSKEGRLYQVDLSMQEVRSGRWGKDDIHLDTGSPHLVCLRHNIEHMDVYSIGKKLRYDARFGEEGSNVNFIEEKDGILHIRTYERGVENETLSCGTGVTAAAIAWAIREEVAGPLSIKSRGGLLKVAYKKDGEIFTDVVLSGPAEFVFSGEIEIQQL